MYTRQLPTYADPILDRLDPSRYIAYRRATPATAKHPHTPVSTKRESLSCAA